MKIARFKAASILCVAIFLATMVSAAVLLNTSGEEKRDAKKLELRLSQKISEIDRLCEKALLTPSGDWLSAEGVPQDYVIYRYEADTLQSWVHRFPVMNDDISPARGRMMLFRQQFQYSPLAEVTESWSCMQMGGRSFLVKLTKGRKGVKIISGINLSMIDELSEGGTYRVAPLFVNEGSLVECGGMPQFKLVRSNEGRPGPASRTLIFISLAFLILGAFLWLASDRRLPYAFVVIAITAFALAGVMRHIPLLKENVWGIYVIVNALLTLSALALSMVKTDLFAKIHSRAGKTAVAVVSLLAMAGVYVYSALALHDISNRTIASIELYKLDTLNTDSLAIIVSFLVLTIVVPVAFGFFTSAVEKLGGKRINHLSLGCRTALAVVSAVFFVVIAASYGASTENRIVREWAGKLAFERDMPLERQLRAWENMIATDPYIAASMDWDNPQEEVYNRLKSRYFQRLRSDYELNVTVGAPGAQEAGEPISVGSRFLYTPSQGGRCRYHATFLFYGEFTGVSAVEVSVSPRSDVVFKPSSPLSVFIPSIFSYAKYDKGIRQFYRGSYAYPYELDSSWSPKHGRDYLFADNFIHYIVDVGQDAVVVISRPRTRPFLQLISALLMALLLFGLYSLLCVRIVPRTDSPRSLYKSQILAVVMVSLLLTMALLAVVSMLFVYQRNEDNTQTMLSGKISSVRVMVQSGLSPFDSVDDMPRKELFELIRRIGDDTNSSISLYRPDGRIFISTVPQSLAFNIQSGRMNEDAYDQIMHGHKGFIVQRESMRGRTMYALYAPVLSAEGKVLAIVEVPYRTGDYDFENEAVLHSATVITVFLVLLVVSYLLATAIVGKMFEPLKEMSEKMETADLGSLEYINYERKDEISAIVDSYNRMVRELKESSRKLAQAERDKAWSEMARQVAHEIKNPLTPMKLQLQRVQRLKSMGDPSWQEKFDEMAKVLLDHIDVLSDTANEFSTFAHLYSEEPVDICLDAMLRDEITMFESHPEVKFEYIGLDNVCVKGPKPQITRVFVNLLGNAVQACLADGGKEHRVVVSLRNSVRDGFYDIVFEDDGPGVNEANIDKLFTPNFTTKTGGSGLGLAISRSILEKCGATIEYSRSVMLGGACFTIRYPRA